MTDTIAERVREACAQVCEERARRSIGRARPVAESLAAAIRALDLPPDPRDAESAALREALLESLTENLEHRYYAGTVKDDGQWITGGMSDAERFARMAGVDPDVPHDARLLLARIPAIAAAEVGKIAPDCPAAPEAAP